MFDELEQKLLLIAVNKRCLWLKKMIDETPMAPKLLAEYKKTYQALYGAAKKIEHITPTDQPKTCEPKTRRVALDEARILIAEDDPDSAMLLEGILDHIGIKHITITQDGKAAIKAIQNTSPSFNIILCDWDMPEVNGLEVQKRVRHLVKSQGIHFIMVTAVTESARIKEAISEGITDYVIKPVDAAIIEKKIKAALSRSKSPLKPQHPITTPLPGHTKTLGNHTPPSSAANSVNMTKSI